MTTGKQSPTLDLSIGPVRGTLTLHGGGAAFIEAARARYAAFLLPETSAAEGPAFACAIELRDATAVGQPPTPSSRPFAPPLVVCALATQTTVKRWDFAAELRAPAHSTSPWTGSGVCLQSPYALDSLLRVLWSVFLPRTNAALIHACGVIHPQHGAFVFPGRSSSGKTTLARKIEDPDRVLSDELVVLGLDSAGRARAWGTPFWGEFQRGGISMLDHPLRGIFFLEQGSAVRTLPLLLSEGVFRFLECFVCFQQDFDTARNHLALVSSLLSAAAFGALVSRRTSSERQVLKALEAHNSLKPLSIRHARAA